MPVGVKLFNHEKLSQARKARGITSSSLAAIADVSAPSISLYEKGTQKPQQDVIDRLASALNVPPGYFFGSIAVRRPEKLFYRSMSSATKAARSKAEAQYEWGLEIIEYLLDFFDFPKTNLPSLDVPADFRKLDTLTIESLASQLRAYWNLGDGPIGNMVRTLESNGIVVLRMPLEAEKLDAFSEFRRPHPIVVLSSDKDNFFRSRFDAAHELGHLILHQHIDKTNLKKAGDFKLIEQQAHLFAGAFLLPSTTYSTDLWAISLDAFRSLKPKWDVSIAMQIMRTRQLELVDDEQEKRLWINCSRRKWRHCEPLDDTTPPELPTLVHKGVKMLLDAKAKSAQQLVQDLSLLASDIERICDLPIGFLRDLQIPAQPTFKGSEPNVVPFRRS